MSCSQIYIMDEIMDLDETINGMMFFRKMTTIQTELIIGQILMDNPHPNIVNIYHIGSNYIDMELLSPYDTYVESLEDSMYKAKEHLQSLGIMYIDWRPYNTGLSVDNNQKLFDFDMSGIIDIKTQNWIVQPLEYRAYYTAKNEGILNPCHMDNFLFEEAFIKKNMDI